MLSASCCNQLCGADLGCHHFFSIHFFFFLNSLLSRWPMANKTFCMDIAIRQHHHSMTVSDDTKQPVVAISQICSHNFPHNLGLFSFRIAIRKIAQFWGKSHNPAVSSVLTTRSRLFCMHSYSFAACTSIVLTLCFISTLRSHIYYMHSLGSRIESCMATRTAPIWYSYMYMYTVWAVLCIPCCQLGKKKKHN